MMMRDWEAAHERTPDALEEHCRAAWEMLRRPRLQPHVASTCLSMRTRLRLCITARGGWTKY